MRILVTGATGYIGGRLVPRLLQAGHEVRCLARRPEKLHDLTWTDQVEIVHGDVLDPASLTEAAGDCEVGVYLVHSMATGSNFEEHDREAAANFRDAADAAGMRRIVYLGGLGPDDPDLSPHLASRREVGRILASGATPATEMRAAVIIGSGSLSFEMLRYLTEVLPVMVTPRWVHTRCQPIGVGDILDLLVRTVSDLEPVDRILEIGGPDVLTYLEMMRLYAEEAGLRRRLVIPVPFLTPRLSSLWVGLVTPLPSRVARPLVESLRYEVTVGDDRAHQLFPYQPISYREAVRRALEKSAEGPETRWSDAISSPALPSPVDPYWSGGTVFEDRRLIPTDALPHHMFWACTRIGGDVGYYGMTWAWRLRGLLDRMVGGVGLRRGRRHPEKLRVGETVDFWRVDRVVNGQMLRLHAEMRLPGEAWLEWRIIPNGEYADLLQVARFRPRGLFGRLYWYAMMPFHTIIFPRMARKMAAVAEERGYSCAS